MAAKKKAPPAEGEPFDLDWWNSLSDIEQYQYGTYFAAAGRYGADIPVPEGIPTVHKPHPNEVAAYKAWDDAKAEWEASQS